MVFGSPCLTLADVSGSKSSAGAEPDNSLTSSSHASFFMGFPLRLSFLCSPLQQSPQETGHFLALCDSDLKA